MKKAFLTVFSIAILIPAAFAQISPSSSLKQSAIDSLVDYGTKLYERRDYVQAQAVFNRVLSYDGNHAEALKYLNRMNAPVVKQIKQEVVSKPVAKTIIKTPTVKGGDLTIEELRSRINQKKIEVDQLKEQLRSDNYVSTSADSKGNASLNNLHQDLKELRQQVDAKRERINEIKTELNQK